MAATTKGRAGCVADALVRAIGAEQGFDRPWSFPDAHERRRDEGAPAFACLGQSRSSDTPGAARDCLAALATRARLAWLRQCEHCATVRLKRMATPFEFAALKAVETALQGSGWQVALKPRVQDVIDKEEDDDLWDDEFSLYTRGHFDLVVYGGEHLLPSFAIELDGPTHQHPRRVERDIRKNLLCAGAGLPLLRLGGSDLSMAEQIGLLTWLTERFIEWQKHVRRRAPPRTHGLRRPRSPDAAKEVDLMESSLREARLPANLTIARRLHQAGICVGQEIGGHQPERNVPYLLRPVWPGRRWIEYDASAEFKAVELPVFVRSRDNASRSVQVTGRARFSSALLVGPDECWDLPLPWLDPEWVALELALYSALINVEKWKAADGPKEASA